MFDLNYLLLDHDFSKIISNIVENLVNNDDHKLIFNEKINEYMSSLDQEIIHSNLLYIIEYDNTSSFNNDNVNINISLTTGINEIKEVIGIALNMISLNEFNLIINYIDKHNNQTSGYLLKFKDAFVICKNTDNISSQKMACIPVVYNTSKSKLIKEIKEKNGEIRNIIEYSILTNQAHIQDSIKKEFLDNFNRNDIFLNYDGKNFNLECLLKNIKEKCSIIILKDYVKNDLHNYITLIYKTPTQIRKIDNMKNIQNDDKLFVDSGKKLQQNYLSDLNKNIFEAGIFDLINDCFINKKLDSIDKIINLLYTNKIDIMNMDLSYKNINERFKYVLDTISSTENNLKKPELNKKENSTPNFIKNIDKSKTVILSNNNYIDLSEQISYNTIRVVKNFVDNEYYIVLDKIEKLYDFDFIKINKDLFTIILNDSKIPFKDAKLEVIYYKENNLNV